MARRSTDNVSTMVRYALATRRESQVALAQVLGMAPSGLTHRLRGDVPWRVSELDTLADYFGLRPADFLADYLAMPDAAGG